MKSKPKTPEQAMQNVIAGFVKTKQTNASLRRAQQRHQKAEHNLREAVNGYNLAIAERIIAALQAEDLGLCEIGHFSKFHIVKANTLMGVVRTGTRTTGDHYYEHDEHYVETQLKCKDCRENMKLRTGYDSLLELDVTAYWTKFLRNEFSDMYSKYNLEKLLQWAAERGICEVPITEHHSGIAGGRSYYLGESQLSYKPYLGW